MDTVLFKTINVRLQKKASIFSRNSLITADNIAENLVDILRCRTRSHQGIQTFRRTLLITIAILTLSLSAYMPTFAPTAQANDTLPAFPGAEGFGAHTVGGRGGRVIEVTNLNDDGPGSLRAAIATEGPRIVVFRVGGTIELRSRIDIEHPYITIAGQTASGGGILLKNHPSMVHSPLRIITHDVVIRYLRSRPGPSDTPSDVLDALTIADGYNIIIDHSSFSWGSDEVFNIWYDVHDVTVQWSIIAEGLHDSTHPEGKHSMGMLIGSEGAGEISIHHNLFVHNRRRNPKVNMTGMADVVNNVVYNARYAMMIQDTYASPAVNYVGNMVIHGINSVYDYDLRYWNDGNHPPRIYVQGNLGTKRPTEDLEDYWVVRKNDRRYLVDTRHPAPPVTTLPACAAYRVVLANAGATMPMRDAVDERLVNDVRNRTGQILNHPSEVGGWPVIAPGEAPADRDQDGMPDDWEVERGLDPDDASDSSGDRDRDGYTNIEEYLNDLVPPLVPGEIATSDQPVSSATAQQTSPVATVVSWTRPISSVISIFLPAIARYWSAPDCDPTQ